MNTFYRSTSNAIQCSRPSTALWSLLFSLFFVACSGNSSTSSSADSQGSGSSGLYGGGNELKPASQPEPEVEGPVTRFEIETSFGTMRGELYNGTPQHRDNFTKLAEKNFYDGLLFHRVISGFMIQGGDPESRGAAADKSLGSGGPGYTIPAEFKKSYIHKKGALAAARTGDAMNPQRESSGSQFYIVQGTVHTPQSLEPIDQQKGYNEAQRQAYYTVGGTPFLDRDYTVFGEITEGLDIIDKIAAISTGPNDRPLNDVPMTVRILRD